MVGPTAVALTALFAVASIACGGDGEGVSLPFEGSRAVPAGDAVRVAVGARPCELPARAAEVSEGQDAVEIRVIGQELPADAVCAEVLASACVEVPLSEPLAGRRVVDVSGRDALLGAAGARAALRGSCVRVPSRD